MAELQKQETKPRRGCFGRLISILFWLSFGFLLGWVTNEAEQHDWNSRQTYESACEDARNLFERVKSLIPKSPPTKSGGESPSEEDPGNPNSAEPEQPKAKPAQPKVQQPVSELDQLLANGDSSYDGGQVLFDKGKTTSDADRSTEFYKQALGRFEKAMSLYQKAEKLSPDNPRVQKKITKAGTSIYWCKKLQRL